MAFPRFERLTRPGRPRPWRLDGVSQLGTSNYAREARLVIGFGGPAAALQEFQPLGVRTVTVCGEAAVSVARCATLADSAEPR